MDGNKRPREGACKASLKPSQTCDAPAQRAAVDVSHRDPGILERSTRGELAGERGCFRAADRCAITRDVNVGAASSLGIRMREPLPERRIVTQFGACKLRKLRFGFEAESDGDGIA